MTIWRRIWDWFWPFSALPPLHSEVRVSGSYLIKRVYQLPARFRVEELCTTTTGYTVYVCGPDPTAAGELEWVDHDHVRVGSKVLGLVRSPSATSMPEPVWIQGKPYYPEGWREQLRFTVYAG